MNKARILIIEDNLMISELVQHILIEMSSREARQYEIAFAYDGMQGLEQIELFHPDVILLDVQMPRLDGYGVLRALRAEGNTTPVILMTAVVHLQAQIQDLLTDSDVHIVKPFSPSLLYSHVRRQLYGKL